MKPRRQLWILATALGLIGWSVSALRHHWLQSNAYDLGLFDQWVWLISRSSANLLDGARSRAGGSQRLAAICRRFTLQAAAVSAVAARRSGPGSEPHRHSDLVVGPAGRVSSKGRWLACGLWWLQPVVFNTLLFDVHPETWVMPAFAWALWAEQTDRPRLWLALLLLMLGARDGLVLVIGGMGLDLAWRRRWRWSASAAGLAAGWLMLLSRWLYPWLRDGEGPKAAARMFSHLSGGPMQILQNLDWSGGLQYLLLLSLPCLWLWRRQSLPTLLIGMPLVLVNLLSASASYRTLIHHYSLPLAVVAVMAAIDGGLAAGRLRRGPDWALIWATACWLALAKPWFFSGPYLQRLPSLGSTQEAIALVQRDDAVLTTSYLVPQLSQRSTIAFPKRSSSHTLDNSPWTALLLNPEDPGWGSRRTVQRDLLNQASYRNWSCQRWSSGLTLCQQPAAELPSRPGNAPGGGG